jgi:hypothetical protein
MESFVLAETFKYLFMIFSEPGELPFHPDNYVLTTEAHFLPLNIAEMPSNVAEDRVNGLFTTLHYTPPIHVMHLRLEAVNVLILLVNCW